MARPASFGKRENEKKKQEKKQEKLKRKEDRKANALKGAPMEEMFAYVDENGQLTSTPPEFKPKKVIDPESIIISTPKKEESDEPTVLHGRVERFVEEKGYGFIKDLASGVNYFFHISAAPNDIEEGKKVFFELERGQRDMNAVRVRYEE
ncbi:cold shock domain-containing protein [Parabacteroides sp. PF5-9]|uniref:cold-shock protein n=1 Tax=Parabacteroides sp. PF5-9 TaxID=1742404 RepID=UPI0024738794|nr:cold shock domain-containing protein [Parabacteroides sp. PF5-9]MDH6358585.1 cold shock CspA family protein [Parabacteroides sp. PF5-9]